MLPNLPEQSFGFNGATTLQPWKSEKLGMLLIGQCSVLQWGHDFGAVEIGGIQAWMSRLSYASMGPRLCSRGNDYINIAREVA